MQSTTSRLRKRSTAWILLNVFLIAIGSTLLWSKQGLAETTLTKQSFHCSSSDGTIVMGDLFLEEVDSQVTGLAKIRIQHNNKPTRIIYGETAQELSATGELAIESYNEQSGSMSPQFISDSYFLTPKGGIFFAQLVDALDFKALDCFKFNIL